MLLTILYILRKKGKKNLNRLRFKAIFFICVHDLKEQIFSINIYWSRLANFMNNTILFNILAMIIAISLILRHNMTGIAYKILKFESMIRKPIMENHTFFAFVTSSKTNSFTYINSTVIQHL